MPEASADASPGGAPSGERERWFSRVGTTHGLPFWMTSLSTEGLYWPGKTLFSFVLNKKKPMILVVDLGLGEFALKYNLIIVIH